MKKTLSLLLSIIVLFTASFGVMYADGATMPSCVGLKANSITTNSARVDFTIKNPSCLRIKTCGMQIRKSGASSWSTKSETVTSSYQTKSSIPVWYTIGSGKEFNISLSSGTTYEYRGFCVYNGKYYYSSTYKFTTGKTTTYPSCTGLKSSNVTTNSARIDFTIKNPSCLRIKTCGMQIRKSGTSSWSTKSETVTSSYQTKSSIPVWYTIGSGKEFNISLSSGTTYEYRGFCVYNGKYYYSSVATFKTLSSTTTIATLMWPIHDKSNGKAIKSISQGFTSSHHGIDISASKGQKWYSAYTGTVYAIYTGCKTNGNGNHKRTCSPNTKQYWNNTCNNGLGNGVIIKCTIKGSTYYMQYAHMDSVSSEIKKLKKGDTIKKGTYLGTVGDRGYSFGTHAHFEVNKGTVFKNYQNVDPNSSKCIFKYDYSNV